MATFCITGARGFIGRHTAHYLARKGHCVVGLGHGAWPEDDAVEHGMAHWINGEIDESNLSSLASRAGGLDAILHLAGGSAVGPSLAHPLEDFWRTVATTARLLEWTRLEEPRTPVVFASSAAVYGSGHDGCIGETATCAPYSPYGTHKYMMEHLARSYGRFFELSVAVIRFFSVYGPGLQKQLLWDLCRKCAQSSLTVPLGGDGEELRDWLYVQDAVSMLERATEIAGPSCPVINGGTGTGMSIREIANKVCGLWGKGQKPAFSGEARPGDPRSLIADVSLSYSLGMSAHIGIDEGLAAYIDWFREMYPQ